MPVIFISYRRRNPASIKCAKYIYAHLTGQFDEDDVFLDTRSLVSGRQWDGDIKKAIRDAQVMIVVIGPRWMSATTDVSVDYVAREVRLALRSGLTLLPVLVGRTRLPTATQLPRELRGLLDYQALRMPEKGRSRASAMASLMDEIYEAAEFSAQLHLECVSGLILSVQKLEVELDGRTIATVRKNSTYSTSIAPGSHNLRLKTNRFWDAYAQIGFTAGPGETVYLTGWVEAPSLYLPPRVHLRVGRPTALTGLLGFGDDE